MVNKDITVKRDGKRIKATLNGSTPESRIEGEVDNDGMRMLTGLIERIQLAQRVGLQYEGARDLYQIFGYKKVVTADDFLSKYQRQDIATRIIDAPPSATWSNPPIIENKALNDEWIALDRSVKLWNAMYRADRLARLNTFSVLLFGFDDTTNMKRPLNTEGVKELLYIRAVGARLVREITFEDSVRNKRFGLPKMYRIEFDDPKTKSVSAGQLSIKGQRDLEVHHSRIVHVVENSLEDQIFGTPIMEKVYNLLDDLLKVAGGTSETYWLQGRGGIQANVDSEMEIAPDDAAALSDEIDEYMHQLRRFIRTRGVDLNVLDTRVPNPKEVFNMIIALISGTTGIPKRILVGAEAGQLASEQDRANWAERIEERRSLFCEPIMLEPTVDLLQTSGLLSEGMVEFNWPSAFIQNPLEEGQTKAQTARAIGNISRQTGNKVPMQLTSREEAREIIGLEGDLDESEILEQPEEEPSGFGGGAPDEEEETSTPPPERGGE